MNGKQRAAMQAALEALEETIDNLRAALAEPEAKQLPPLPECYVTSGGRDLWREEDLIAYGRACAALAEPPVKDHLTAAEPYLWYADDTGDTWTPEAVADGYAPTDLRPLYAAPPRREWVGLKDDERNEIADDYMENHGVIAHGLIKTVEAELKERNT